MSSGMFISFARLDYKCPHCKKLHYDKNDELCEKLNKSKNFYLVIECMKCKKSFGYTVDITGKSVGFKL